MLEEGSSTTDDAVSIYGQPQTIFENSVKGTLVYGYHYSTVQNIAVGLPPFFIYGLRSDEGFNLNLVFVGGVYQGYELTRRQ